MRWALNGAVHSHLHYDTELTRFHRRLALRKPGQITTKATAQKILKVVYCMLRDGEPFQP